MDTQRSEAEPFRLLIVCTGNTCRSPMAEVIARQKVSELGWAHVEVGSAGVGAFQGSPASGGAVRAAAVSGLDLSTHQSTQLTSSAVASSDLILTMSSTHLVRVQELGGDGRAEVITSFAAEGDQRAATMGVPDPIGGPYEEYLATFHVLDDLITKSLERIRPVLTS
jgi:protein-tyrosine-phosphatase